MLYLIAQIHQYPSYDGGSVFRGDSMVVWVVCLLDEPLDSGTEIAVITKCTLTLT